MRVSLFCLVLLGCGSSTEVPSSPVAAVSVAAVIDAAVPDPNLVDATSVDAAPGTARFACTSYQTFCGGISRFAYVCREMGGSHVLTAHEIALPVPQHFGQAETVEVELRHQAIPPKALTLTANTCAGSHTFDIVVNAELVRP